MRKSFLVLFFKKELLLGLVVVLCLARPTWAVETLTLDTIEDPIYEAAIWALETGKVSDPSVDIKMQLMPIPRNQAATMAQAFNITSTGLIAELFGARSGLGYLMQDAQDFGRADEIIAICFVIVLFVALGEWLVWVPLARRQASGG